MEWQGGRMQRRAIALRKTFKSRFWLLPNETAVAETPEFQKDLNVKRIWDLQIRERH
jgi:hypothetical protein